MRYDGPGTIQAVVIMLTPIITLIALWVSRRSPLRWTRVLASVFAALGVALLGSLSGLHCCRAGTPTNQWLVPAVCAFFIFLIPKNNYLRWSGVASALLLGVALSLQYVKLVHTRHYIGNPQADREMASLRQMDFKSLLDALTKQAATDNTIYHAGWLSEVLPAAFQAEYPVPEEHQIDVHPLWHTWLTNLYRRDSRRVDYWFPGGTLRDGISRIETRARAPDLP